MNTKFCNSINDDISDTAEWLRIPKPKDRLFAHSYFLAYAMAH